MAKPGALALRFTTICKRFFLCRIVRVENNTTRQLNVKTFGARSAFIILLSHCIQRVFPIRGMEGNSAAGEIAGELLANEHINEAGSVCEILQSAVVEPVSMPALYP